MKTLSFTISSFCKTGSGTTPSRDKYDRYFNGTIPWVKSGELRESIISFTDEKVTEAALAETSLKIAPKGAILVAMYGANVGRVGILGIDAATNQAVCYIVPDADKACARYIFHALQQKLPEFILRSVGGAQPNISQEIIKRTEIFLPPLEEQRRIAEILDRAESLRAMRRQSIEQLNTLTQAIFIEMFGDPDTNPKGWDVKPVAEYVAEFQGGKSIESESGENVITQNRILKVSAVTGMKFLAHESKPVSDSYNPPPDHFVKSGDLLFSRANTTELVGAVAYVENTPSNLLLPDKLWRFVWQKPATTEPFFIWALFQTPALRYEISRRATGTSGSMKNISQEKVFGIKTILPPIELQQKFTQRVKAIEKLKTTHQKSLTELDALFASLQHRAFRGEL